MAASTEPALALARLKAPLKDSYERLNKDAKELHTAMNNYGKGLEKVRTDHVMVIIATN